MEQVESTDRQEDVEGHLAYFQLPVTHGDLREKKTLMPRTVRFMYTWEISQFRVPTSNLNSSGSTHAEKDLLIVLECAFIQ